MEKEKRKKEKNVVLKEGGPLKLIDSGEPHGAIVFKRALLPNTETKYIELAKKEEEQKKNKKS